MTMTQTTKTADTTIIAGQLAAMRDKIRVSRHHGVTRDQAAALLADLTCAQLAGVNQELGYTSKLIGRRDRQIQQLVENAVGALLNSYAIFTHEQRNGAWSSWRSR